MLLPLPVCRGVFAYGAHLWVPRDADEAQLHEADEELCRRIEAASRRAAEELQGCGTE